MIWITALLSPASTLLMVTVLDNVSGLYGSIEGIVGSQKALRAIEARILGRLEMNSEDFKRKGDTEQVI